MQAAFLFDLAGLLARFHDAYPGIHLNLEQASSVDLIERLRDGALDITFATADDAAAADLVNLPLVSSPLAVVCRTDDDWSGRDGVGLTEVAERELVGFPIGWGVRTLADSAMRSADLAPRVSLEVNDIGNLLDIVEARLGVALVPVGIVRQRPQLQTVNINTGSWYWTIGAQVVAPEPINPAARALWTMLQSDESPV